MDEWITVERYMKMRGRKPFRRPPIDWVYDKQYLVCKGDFDDFKNEWVLRRPEFPYQVSKYVTHIMLCRKKPSPPEGEWTNKTKG